MHLSPLPQLSLLRVLLAASGLRNIYPLVAIAAAAVTFFPKGAISTVGPFTLYPELRVALLASLLLATATAISHAPTGSAVIRRCLRVDLLRVGSVAVAAILAAGVIALAHFLGDGAYTTALVRNYLWLSGIGLVFSAVFGVIYAWYPLVAIFALSIVIPFDESDWSLYGMFLREQATAQQLIFASAIFALGAALFITNPRNFGYLPRYPVDTR